MDVALIVGAVVLFVGGIVYISILIEKKRTEAMTRYAKERGYRFQGIGTDIMNMAASFKLFTRGRSRRVKNAMHGSKGHATLAVADYRFTTGTGKNTSTHDQTICVVRVPGLALPHFFIRRQVRFFDALGKLFGGQDVNFPNDEAFSKAWVLQTSGSEDELRRSFHARARTHFTGLAKDPPQVEGAGETILLHFGTRLKPEQIDGLVDAAVSLCRLWTTV